MMNPELVKVPIMAELVSTGKYPEYLFWVGSAGSYDDRAKKISRAFARILLYCKIDFAILGTDETDSGDVARRAGNEFLFQMQALQNIETFNNYQVKKIITCCPHDYNTFKNEYPDLGGKYQVFHHTEFILDLIKNGKIAPLKEKFSQKLISYHDPCYLGRGNGIYEQAREIIKMVSDNFSELSRNRSRSLCCGAGGAQMFKEAEKGNMEVYSLRTQDILQINPEIVVTACPFCMTMLTDGIKMADKADELKILDLAELIAEANDI